MLRRALNKWGSYKYRFVPWISMNLKDRSVRVVDSESDDKIIPSWKVNNYLLHLFSELHNGGGNTERFEELIKAKAEQLEARQLLQLSGRKQQQRSAVGHGDSVCSPSDVSHGDSVSSLNAAPPSVNPPWDIHYMEDDRTFTNDEPIFTDCYFNEMMACQNGVEEVHQEGLDAMHKVFGFVVKRSKSSLVGGGSGVRVTDGRIPRGAVVALYPGTVYRQHEPVFFQSLANPFIFRCIDGVLIDGNDGRISKFLFKSCSQRDRLGSLFTSDMSWLTPYPTNPLAVGQYVNNHNKRNPPNVAYQEFHLPDDFPLHFLQFIPNVWYSSSIDYDSAFKRSMRLIALVALRDIQQGEELFSSYFTIIH